MTHKKVFLDTNVIIECFRISVWGELSKAYHLETVEEVLKEALTGNTSDPNRVNVDIDLVKQGLFTTAHQVNRKERNALTLRYPLTSSLDPGEKDLFAYLHTHVQPMPSALLVDTADKGAIVAMHKLGWLENLVSLEELLQNAGCSPTKLALIGLQHSKKWLSQVRTDVFLGVIP